MTETSSNKLIVIRDFFTFFYLFPLRTIAAILPSKITRLISLPLVALYSFLPVSKKRRTSINRAFSSVFSTSKTEKEIRILTQQCLRNAVYTFIDDIILNKLDRDGLLKRGAVQGLENLEEALSHKKGVLLIGGHFTGDRVSKRLLREIGFPIMNVRSKSPVNPSTSVVERKYFVPIMTKILDDVLQDSVYIEDKGFSIDILRRLRENGLVSILFDAITVRKGMYCYFFGHRHFFPTNFLQIARVTGAAIVPMLCVGNSTSFTVIIDKKLELQQFSEKEAFISANLNGLVKIFESQILQYPSHWLVL